MRTVLVVILLAALFGCVGAVIGYLVAGGDPAYSPIIAGVLGSLLTIGFCFFVAKGDDRG